MISLLIKESQQSLMVLIIQAKIMWILFLQIYQLQWWAPRMMVKTVADTVVESDLASWDKVSNICSNTNIDIFQSTFLQPVKDSKNSILNWVMKLNLFMFFCLFVFETPLQDFPFYLPILLTLWFRDLQTRIKETCICV